MRHGPKREKYVECVCSVCKKLYLISPSNIRTGKTTNCRCQRAVKYEGDPRARVLGERYDAMVQRCTNPKSDVYRNYGARGIELRFDSREHFIRWMLETLPHATYEGVQIDRKDNDGHYEPGNLRLVTQAGNLRNKRTNHRVTYRGQEVLLTHVWHLMKTDNPAYPLGSERTTVLIREGGTPDELLWRERLRAPSSRTSTTSSTPDPAIVSLYRIV